MIDVFRRVGGFNALQLARAYDVLKAMVEDAETLRFLSFTGNLVATGLRELIASAIAKGLFHAVVTTAGALDHDIAKSMGARYVEGHFDADDAELARHSTFRLGNIFIRREEYGPLVERLVFKALDALEGGTYGTYELAWEFGKHIIDEGSILRQAYLRKVPIFIPGITDGAVGTAILAYSDVQRARSGGKNITVDVFKDERSLSELVESAGKLGALIVGGGISKHHVIWWAQFKGGLDYAVYLTTATEYDGSLSGARPREAISWGKIKPTARHAYVHCDATITLPILLRELV